MHCDFENDWCQFTQAADDTFDWSRHSGSTSSTNTGPSNDHTTGTGVHSISINMRHSISLNTRYYTVQILDGSDVE